MKIFSASLCLILASFAQTASAAGSGYMVRGKVRNLSASCGDVKDYKGPQVVGSFILEDSETGYSGNILILSDRDDAMLRGKVRRLCMALEAAQTSRRPARITLTAGDYQTRDDWGNFRRGDTARLFAHEVLE